MCARLALGTDVALAIRDVEGRQMDGHQKRGTRKKNAGKVG